MTFLYPFGFLALVAIPVLIFIYIIKNRYTEQTVSSTYLWTLSEKFIRHRIPINKLTGLLSLILQILAVVLISIILAQPVLYIKDAAMEYCFILDGSGSMNIAQGGSTRFEQGKKKIAEMIEDSVNGSTYHIIFAGDEVFGESFTGGSGKKSAKQAALDALYSDLYEISYSDASPNAALAVAQNYFDEHPSVKTYLITDRTYEETGNITVINLLSATENYGVSDVEYYYDSSDKLVITGNVISYGNAATLTLDFYFDGSDELYGWTEVSVPSYEEYLAGQATNVGGGEEQKTFTYTTDLSSFKSFKVRIRQKDSLDLDNEVIIYDVTHTNYDRTIVVYGKTVIDRDTMESSYLEPNFLEWVLRAAGISDDQLEITTDVNYEGREIKTGYGLYIFINCVPSVLPREGVVWFINPTGNIAGSDFNYQGEVRAANAAKYSTNSSSSVQSRLEGVTKNDFELNYYAKLGKNGNFQELISCDGNPLLLVGTNAYGNREVVFAFDFRASATFVLSADCSTLISNLLKYSFPSVVEETSFISGDTLEINILNDCIGLRVDTPLGRTEYPDISTAISEYTLSEVGVYKVTMTMKDNSERVFYVYSALPVAERVLTVKDQAFIIEGEAQNDRLPGIYDNLLIIFIILAVIAVADFGVYCYEQYQLR